ncbi:hypothetical protein OH76DRAFT_1408804 [Lentinus brumalis]|uniref:Uncharacterized protein n=1 Tax=Lentinus brumalis TaxID=2498619 RepID=A0A371CWS0_9APHY|nr:hypothetical protein OH76DRAFT_1408804 [Polyporus brumalis]
MSLPAGDMRLDCLRFRANSVMRVHVGPEQKQTRRVFRFRRNASQRVPCCSLAMQPSAVPFSHDLRSTDRDDNCFFTVQAAVFSALILSGGCAWMRGLSSLR